VDQTQEEIIIPGPAGSHSPLFFDHAVLVVADLETATREFQRMGFSVVPGGVHAGKLTHNALIAFEDGTYLELLALYSRLQYSSLRLLNRIGLPHKHPSARTLLGRRFAESLLMGQGINDFALGSGQLESVIFQARARNLSLDGPAPGGRQRPDGQQVQWRTACPETRDLPFLIEDVTHREARVPAGQAIKHFNQVCGVAALTVAVADLAASTARYTALLDALPVETGLPAYTVAGAGASCFLIKDTTLALEQIESVPRDMRRTNVRQADRPCRIWLRSSETSIGLSILEYTPGQGYRLSTIPASGRVG
jgi:hypothetical protein